MLHKFSRYIVRKLLKYEVISENDCELYEYAAFSFIFNLFPLFLSAMIGAVLNMFCESILFIIPYVSLRTFSGGFHLKSSKACFVITNLLLLISLIIIERIISIGTSFVFLIIIILSAFIVFFLSPIDSEARELTHAETRAFKRVARIIVITFLTVVLVLYCLNILVVAYPIGMGIILTAALQLPCCINKRMRKSTLQYF